ncbi:MAG: ADP-ribosylglycohydrolase family protein [Brevinemataceae bacterium]
MSTENQIKACLFGDAIGDALGGPVEFLGLTDIEEKYGKFTDLLIDEYIINLYINKF